jgi:dipeptidase E
VPTSGTSGALVGRRSLRGARRCQDREMRMLLTSGGIRRGPVEDALVELLGKPLSESRIAVIVDAMLPFPGDKSMMLRHLDENRSLGWAEFDVLSLFSGPRSVIEARLRSADVIFGYGGSNHWLSHAWTANGLVPVLRELLDEKVYVGHSAGSMIFSRHHAAAVDAFDDHEEVEMLQLDHVAAAVPLFDWAVLCHLGAPFLPENATEWAAEGAAKLRAPVWFLDDDSALLVRDPAADPQVVSDGHWLRFDENGAVVDSR